jgi:hypothetical protein
MPSAPTNTEVVAARLYHQGLAGDGFADPAAAVRALGAVQAQDYTQGVWALGVRVPGATVATVEAAIEAAAIVRTWPMRGTLHFVPGPAAHWMPALAAERLIAGARRRRAQLGLAAATLERALTIIAAALHGGRLTRSELLGRLAAEGVATDGQRGYHLLWYAAQTGLICLGPRHGKEQTFVPLDAWVPAEAAETPAAPLVELARRYVGGHGPASERDFSWWSGQPLGAVRPALAALEHELERIEVGGVTYWQTPGPIPPLDPEAVLLLPGFDQYLLGYQDRAAVLPPESAARVVPGGNGMFKAIVVSGGQVIGTWGRTQRKAGLTVTITPFAPLTIPRTRLETAAAAFCAFWQQPLADLVVAAPA